MAQGNVEIWLGKLLDMAKRSVHSVIREAAVAIKDPNFELMDFLGSYPAQVCDNGIVGMSLLYLAYVLHGNA